MKRVLILMLFVSLEMFGQTPKIDVVVGDTENIDGIRAVLKPTEPTTHFSAITGINNSTNSYGRGISGINNGTGVGVYGQSESGTGVAGLSSKLGVLGLGYSGGVGILGQSEDSIGVYGFSSSKIGGFFESETGNALITGIGKVGLGTNTPTKAFLVVDKKIGAVHAIFGENTSGVAIESSWPGISFNGYYNGGRKPLSNGFVGGMAMNPITGLISIYNTFASGTAGNNVTTQDVITLDNFGKVGIGNSNPLAKLHVTGNMRVDALAGYGNVGLYVDNLGTVSADVQVAFSAKSNVNTTSIPFAIQTTVPFNTEDYDLASMYNNSTYEFNAPLNGIYHFDCAVTFAAVTDGVLNSSSYSLTINVDGLEIGKTIQPITIGGIKTLVLSKDIKLTVGQKVKLFVNHNLGGGINLLGNNSGSFFTGRLVTRL